MNRLQVYLTILLNTTIQYKRDSISRQFSRCIEGWWNLTPGQTAILSTRIVAQKFPRHPYIIQTKSQPHFTFTDVNYELICQENSS
mmetsp:Transcript_1917/g.4225  ORF Transcript_1917/g.4225 Transcript_1917/m.4225 type:complete len:86 (-) Transcript_1917:195-452(-)